MKKEEEETKVWHLAGCDQWLLVIDLHSYKNNTLDNKKITASSSHRQIRRICSLPKTAKISEKQFRQVSRICRAGQILKLAVHARGGGRRKFVKSANCRFAEFFGNLELRQFGILPDLKLPDVFRGVFYKTDTLKTMSFWKCFPPFFLDIFIEFAYFSKQM